MARDCQFEPVLPNILTRKEDSIVLCYICPISVPSGQKPSEAKSLLIVKRNMVQLAPESANSAWFRPMSLIDTTLEFIIIVLSLV